MESRLRLVLKGVLGGRRRKKMMESNSGDKKNTRGFSVNPEDYKLMEEVGYGASTVVYRAIYLPTKDFVAIKCLDLDRCNTNLDDIRREAQTMSLIDHPNVIKSFCSFAVDHYLWIVMPFMAQGSCLHLMKAAYPDGFEESAICSILKETLKALDYLHRQGHIYRDVKAGNILLDNTGEIKLGDFGVSACLYRQRARNTFVGTPCWMAPEVLQPGSGYNSKADIWSFGITALELAQGHAPFSKYFPMKMFLMTTQNAPPGLDYDRNKNFSKLFYQSFKELVALCLVKDQTKRPTAEKLLKHSFFKNAKPPEICVKKLFANLPPLWTRVKALQAKDAAQLADQEAISQIECHRVSAWNFNIEEFNEQASLLDDHDILAESMEEDELFDVQLHNKVNDRGQVHGKQLLSEKMNEKEEDFDNEVVEPNCEEKVTLNSTASSVEQATPNSGHGIQQAKGKPVRLLTHGIEYERSVSDRYLKPSVPEAPSFSGPLNLPNRASENSFSAPSKFSGDDKSKANVVQIKGRFSVTSEKLDPARVSPLRKSASVGNWILDSKMQPPTGQPVKDSNSLMPQLQYLFQQNSIQQDLIMNLLKSLQQAAEATDSSQNGRLSPLARGSDSSGAVVDLAATERERLLVTKISELRARVRELTEELEEENSRHTQLHQKLKSLTCCEQL